MQSIKQHPFSGLSKPKRRHVQVRSMEDLVEGQGSKGPKPRGFVKRFWEKTNVRNENDCWEWSGPFFNSGYGYLSIANIGHLAHRISFLIAHGKIDPDLLVMHSCDNRKCVNPSHLSQGTDADNICDAISKGRLQKGERNGMAKLTHENVLEIKQMWKSGVSMKDIALKHNVLVPCIWRIIHRIRWGYLI